MQRLSEEFSQLLTSQVIFAHSLQVLIMPTNITFQAFFSLRQLLCDFVLGNMKYDVLLEFNFIKGEE